MARQLPATLATQIDGRAIAPAFLLHIDWPHDPVYWWTGYGPLYWDGKTWQGTGEFMQISQLGESADGRANGVQLTLSGIPSSVLVSVFRNDFQGRRAEIYLGLFDQSGGLLGNPLCLFEGQLDSASLEDSGETSTAVLQLEKELIDRREDVRRFTHEDQQLDHPGDLFFEYQAWLAMNPITFGKWKSGSGSTTPRGSSWA